MLDIKSLKQKLNDEDNSFKTLVLKRVQETIDPTANLLPEKATSFLKEILKLKSDNACVFILAKSDGKGYLLIAEKSIFNEIEVYQMTKTELMEKIQSVRCHIEMLLDFLNLH